MVSDSIFQNLSEAFGNDVGLTCDAKSLLRSFSNTCEISGLNDYASEAALKCRQEPVGIRNINTLLKGVLQLVNAAYEECETASAEIYPLYDKHRMLATHVHDLTELESNVSMMLAHCEVGEGNIFKRRIAKDMSVAFNQQRDEKLAIIGKQFQEWGDHIDTVLQSEAKSEKGIVRAYLESARDLAYKAAEYTQRIEIPLGAKAGIER